MMGIKEGITNVIRVEKENCRGFPAGRQARIPNASIPETGIMSGQMIS